MFLNYMVRIVCGDLFIKMGEWMGEDVFVGLYVFIKIFFVGEYLSW